MSVKFRPILLCVLPLLFARFSRGQLSAATGPQQSFVTPSFSGMHHQPTVSAFYYIWFNGGWHANLDMVPELGEYLSFNPLVISQHMQWLKQAGADNIIISWWGTNSANGLAIDENVAPVMAAAAAAGIQVIFMIDEYAGRTPQEVQQNVSYLISKYSASPAWYTTTRVSPAFDDASVKPVFLVYYSGSDVSPTPSQWTTVNAYIHKNYNAVMLVHYDYDPTWTTVGGFDGMFGYGVEDPNGSRVLAQSLSRHAWYIPTTYPGFNAYYSKGWTNITPRNNGATYQQNCQNAIDIGTNFPMVSITSFNEWSETTQIEPCGEGVAPLGNTYEDYGALGANGYLTATANWVPQVHNYEFYDYSLTPSVYTQPGSPNTDMGLWQVSWGTQAASQVTSVGGQYAASCQSGSYLLDYQVAQVYGSTAPTSYTIRVDYFDAGSQFRLAYNTTPNAQIHNYSTWIVPGNTNTWQTAIFTVPNAVFDGSFGGSSDFRFETPSGGNFDLGVVEVTKN